MNPVQDGEHAHTSQFEPHTQAGLPPSQYEQGVHDSGGLHARHHQNNEGLGPGTVTGQNVRYNDEDLQHDNAQELHTEYDEKGLHPAYSNEKRRDPEVTVLSAAEEGAAQHDLELTGNELDDLEHKLDLMTTERATKIISQLYMIHEHDPNFPRPALDRMQEFLQAPDSKDHPDLLREMKVEALLATENSPYLEVRANVDPTDDVTTPALTFRVLLVGSIFSACGAFIDTLFGYRNLPVSVGPNVAQLLAYPCCKALERLPTRKFRIFGKECSLNPGPFNKKEHMLITIMANVSFGAPYTNYIVPAQALPQFFNQEFAYNRGYQFLNTLGTNFVGYGLAGLTRRFLVYPAIAVWPSSLVIIGLNKAFHTKTNETVRGPFGTTWKMSREKFFLCSFLAMFIWFWFPGYLFQALSVFSWMTWIAPNNANLDTVTGFFGGMGLNPWPTFDWNNLTVWLYPLTIPTFSIINMFFGILIGAFMTLAVYYQNGWNTGYMPINSNTAFDNTGVPFNVSRILTDGEFDNEKYQAYSQPWMSAGYCISFLWYFALYSSTATYVAIYHRHDVVLGFRALGKSIKRSFKRLPETEELEDDLSEDVHYRLMKKYPEVPEWQYLIVLLISMVLGMAVTGIPVPLNVLAEVIGGALVAGNANGLMYFKTYGYIAVYQALAFCSDLKLAHYLKIPPRSTFYMQLWATLIYCIVSACVFNLALSFKGVCTAEAEFRFTCPNQRTFFTSTVFWGTLSPKRLFGPGKRYNLMLLGFPLGVVMVLIYWGLRKMFPRSEFLRQVHPVMIAAGPSTWGSPYNMSYFIGNVYVVLISFQWLRKRYTGFWAKYNYVIAASFPAGIAIATLVIFFGLQIPHGGIEVNWWGNNVVGLGCEGQGGCPNLQVPEVGYWGDAPGSGKFT